MPHPYDLSSSPSHDQPDPNDHMDVDTVGDDHGSHFKQIGQMWPEDNLHDNFNVAYNSAIREINGPGTMGAHLHQNDTESNHSTMPPFDRSHPSSQHNGLLNPQAMKDYHLIIDGKSFYIFIIIKQRCVYFAEQLCNEQGEFTNPSQAPPSRLP